MKVKVIKDFVDKHTKDLHKVNDILTVSKERFEEINSTSHGAFVEAISDTDVKQPDGKKICKE